MTARAILAVVLRYKISIIADKSNFLHESGSTKIVSILGVSIYNVMRIAVDRSVILIAYKKLTGAAVSYTLWATPQRGFQLQLWHDHLRKVPTWTKN